MATATQNIGTLGDTYSGIRAHAERTYQNHSNKDIDKDYSKYNQCGHMDEKGKLVKGIVKNADVEIPMYRKLAQDYFKPVVEEHNKKAHSKNRMWTVEDKVKQNEKKINRELIITIGNEENDKFQFMHFKKSLMDVAKRYDKVDFLTQKLKKLDVTYDEYATILWKRMMSRALVSYIKGYNDRRDALKITDYATNVDESGAPHVHCRLVTLGESVDGRRNFSLNGALYREYKDDPKAITHSKLKNGKEKKLISARHLMQKYRHDEDTKLIEVTNAEVKADFESIVEKQLNVSEEEIKKNPYDDLLTVDFGVLERKGKDAKTGRTMDEYKADKALQEKNQKLEQENERLSTKNQELIAMNDHLKKVQSDFKTILDIDTRNVVDYLQLGYNIVQTLPGKYSEQEEIKQLARHHINGNQSITPYEQGFTRAVQLYHNFEQIHSRNVERAKDYKSYQVKSKLEQELLDKMKADYLSTRNGGEYTSSSARYVSDMICNDTHSAYILNETLRECRTGGTYLHRKLDTAKNVPIQTDIDEIGKDSLWVTNSVMSKLSDHFKNSITKELDIKRDAEQAQRKAWGYSVNIPQQQREVIKHDDKDDDFEL